MLNAIIVFTTCLIHPVTQGLFLCIYTLFHVHTWICQRQLWL